jgi:hypothetical protein
MKVFKDHALNGSVATQPAIREYRGQFPQGICGQIDKLIIHPHGTYTPSELSQVAKSKRSSSLASSSSVAISPNRA